MHILLRTVLLLVLVASVVSCKKDEEEGPASPILSTLPDPNAAFDLSDFSLLTEGNYWVYERRTYDSTGLQLGLGVDSFFFAGDTVINGNTYMVQRRTSVAGTTGMIWRIMRDSADCLVNHYGGLVFRYGVFDQIAWTDTIAPILYIDYSVFSDPVPQFVPAGNIVCYKLLGTVGMITTGFPPVPPARYPYAYWAPRIGKVKDMEPYISSGWVVVRELLRYHAE